MAKIEVSNSTYNEISVLLKRQGREINDGMALSIEKGTAIVPPHDFRMVAVRQNCLMSAAQAYQPSHDASGDAVHDSNKFLNFCDEIFNWCLNGREIDKNPDKAVTKGWK
jgi:hypothetical protein